MGWRRLEEPETTRRSPRPWRTTLSDTSAEDEAAYRDITTPPMLASDGVTILIPLRGQTEDGVYYDGTTKVVPGDPRYDELLPLARTNPAPAPSAQGRPFDPDTRYMLRRAAGLE